MSKWEYKGYYKKYNMEGEINIGTGILKVHDIFEPLPDFMKKADCIFCDPPCSTQNINAFYTKADRTDYQESYDPFRKRFFEVIDEINPKRVFVEVFKSNKDYFEEELRKRYPKIKVYETTYYHKKDCICWIIQAGEADDRDYPFDGMDEEDCIKYICTYTPYDVIGDPCMGMGLVGFFANQAGRKFVGTEINKKRLGVLLHRIETNKL